MFGGAQKSPLGGVWQPSMWRVACTVARCTFNIFCTDVTLTSKARMSIEGLVHTLLVSKAVGVSGGGGDGGGWGGSGTW